MCVFTLHTYYGWWTQKHFIDVLNITLWFACCLVHKKLPHLCLIFLCVLVCFLFAWSVPLLRVVLHPLTHSPPPLQPHLLPLKRYIWSAWAPPASRWVGWHRLLLAATAPLCATQSATRPWLERTQSGTRWRASVQTPPATCWRGWRSGLSIRCGWGHTLTWARAQRVPQWGWKPKRMVGGHLPWRRVLSDSVSLLCGAAVTISLCLSTAATEFLFSSCWSLMGGTEVTLSFFFPLSSLLSTALTLHISAGLSPITPGPQLCTTLLSYRCLNAFLFSFSRSAH